MKDNFSDNADQYARFRPDYPEALIHYILQQTAAHQTAWDCGTGNGQLAKKLSPHFATVYATDISAEQLANAATAENIIYQLSPAEQTDFSDKQFDLITVAQAVHWFQFDHFYQEVYRTLKDGGLVVIAGYSLLRVSPEIDRVLLHFYKDIVGPYWDEERKYIDDQYLTIPFPFQDIAAPELEQQYLWTFEQLIGYLCTWSAVKHFIKEEGSDPVLVIADALKTAWGMDERREVAFPTLIRAGRKYNSHL
jgi:ubiquinone/menaquinone biosynthesis C-methylase UbiE